MTNTRKFVAALAAAASVGAVQAAVISGADDVLFVAGSGSNQATLIIDFNDGLTKESFAWGFRWDGVASGADMIATVAAEDPNLSLVYSGNGTSGFYLTTVTYFDGDNLHTGIDGPDPGGYLFWGYNLAGGTADDDNGSDPGGIPTPVPGGGNLLPISWTSSPVGAALDSFGNTGRILADGAWDAWSFGTFNPNYSTADSPPQAALVPEPSSGLLWGGALFLALIRRQRG